MTMLEPSSLKKDHDLGIEQYWKIHDRLSNKEGFHHNIYWITGDQYRGYWKHNKKDGSGIHVYRNGNRYEGEWRNGKREGQGTFWVAKEGRYKAMYRGTWGSGKWHGKGIFYGDKGEVYEGEFEYGKRTGFGKQTYWCDEFNAFEVYVGQWLNDKREGSGILYMVDGDRYEGAFSNDKRAGKGSLFYRDGASVYEGLWHDDKAICGTYKKLLETNQETIPLLEIAKSDTLADDILNESIASIEAPCNKPL